MTTISEHTSGALELELTWKSDIATHTEAYRAEHVNFWRDIFPKVVTNELMGSQPKDRLPFLFSPGEIIPSYATEQVFDISAKKI